MIGPKRKPGHPALDWRRKDIMQRFGLKLTQPYRDLSATELDQLYACKDDSARRLLLGIGERNEP